MATVLADCRKALSGWHRVGYLFLYNTCRKMYLLPYRGVVSVKKSVRWLKSPDY